MRGIVYSIIGTVIVALVLAWLVWSVYLIEQGSVLGVISLCVPLIVLVGVGLGNLLIAEIVDEYGDKWKEKIWKRRSRT